QRPITEAAWAAVQPASRAAIDLVSVGRPPLTLSLDALAPVGVPIAYDEARRMFQGDQSWAAYIAGVVLVLAREREVPLRSGLRIVVWSTVPEGKGVSSSAAVEVATMHAAARALGCELPGRDLALLCQ